MQQMTYEEAADYLKTAALRGSRLGLERVTGLCRLLGSPQDSLEVIHVAGTNGKGSFGAMLSAILTASGIKTGWFSSPALTGYTDHYRIGGECITEERFAELIDEVSGFAESMEDKPTEFEILAAAAYLLFRQENCGICIAECGMGGDTDATNVISSPLLSVITNVQHDHSGFLGSTIPEIAAHKAGIIKEGCPVIFGGSDREALDVVRRTASRKNAPLYLPDRDSLKVIKRDIYGTDYVWTSGNGSMTIKTGLTGEYQYSNLLNVLTAAELLRKNGTEIPDAVIADSLGMVRWHGRFEVLSRSPLVIFDGAHNPDGMRSAVKTMENCFGEQKAVIVMGVMADKDYRLYGEMLTGRAERIFTVTPDNPRALAADALADALCGMGLTAVPCTSVKEGTELALKAAGLSGAPVVALGSLYMYREFTEALDTLLSR